MSHPTSFGAVFYSLGKRTHNNLVPGLSLLTRTLEANLMLELVEMEPLLKNWPQPATEDLLQPTPKWRSIARD
jgi:hypothetical protein